MPSEFAKRTTIDTAIRMLSAELENAKRNDANARWKATSASLDNIVASAKIILDFANAWNAHAVETDKNPFGAGAVANANRKEDASEKAKMTQAESDVASVIDATSAAVDSIGQAKRQLQFAPWASRMGPELKNNVDRAVEHLNGADTAVRAIAKGAGDWGVRAADAAKWGKKEDASEKGVVPMSRDEFSRYAGLLRDLGKRVGALNTSMIGIGQVEAFAAASTDYTTTRSKIWDGSDGIQKALSSFEEAAGASFKAAPAPAPKRKERGDDERIGDRDPASFLPVYKA